MAAYAIGQLTIHNQEWMAQYNEKMGPLLQKYAGKVIAKGQPTRLEGYKALPTVMLNIEFPDMVAAQEWYNDAENQPLIRLRQSGAALELLLVDGL